MPQTKESESGSESNFAVKEKRTRRRRITCCENCRSSKSKCRKYPDPCERCLVNDLECVYLPQDRKGWGMIRKRKEEHQKIDNKIAKRASMEEDSESELEEGSDIEPSPLIATDAAYEDNDDFEDNGVRVGRFNLTKRIGSDYRPKMIEELTQMLDVNDLFRTDYDRQIFNSLPRPTWLDATAGPKILEPDPDYIAPSLFSHTLQIGHHARKVLRSQGLADRIMNHYWECVHPVACTVHRPSFQKRYDVFWHNASRGVNDTPESTQALVYAALFGGVVSMDAETVRDVLGGEREEWVKTLEKATALSLSRANVIRTEKPETMQAFVMYLIPMCRGIISRTLATLVASAIDLARGMGLNNDGTYYGYDAVVTQVHRMIWHQLCFLDIRVCEAQSPRARIRKDDFNTRLPLNVDDSELEKSDLPKASSQRWTGMTLSIARMECNKKIRKIYAARQRTRQGGDSDSAYIKKMLEMICEFRQYMEAKYHPMIDDRIPIQHYTRLVIDLQCRRMHAMVLHQYHMSTPRGRMPEQWIQTVIKSGLETMEIAKKIETSEFLRSWRWYAGALQQHSYATLMLIEIFAFPWRDYAKRAWESLDWIFQVPSCVPHIHKARWVLEGTVDVLKEYTKARKLRCPTLMDERLERAPTSPRALILPGLQEIPSRQTASTAQYGGKGIPRSCQLQVNRHGTISDDHLRTLADTILQDRALSQLPVPSDTRGSLQDMAATSDAQATFMDSVTYGNTEKEPTVENLLTSTPHFARLDRISREDDSHIFTPPNNALDEPMDTTSSGHSVANSASAVYRSENSSVTKPSSYLGSPVVGGRHGDVGETPRARLSDFTQDHRMYHPHRSWDRSTPPLQNPSSVPTRDNDIRHDNSSHSHSRSKPNHNTRTTDQGPRTPPAHHPPSSTPRTSPGFTPINQTNLAPGLLEQLYRSSYAENVQCAAHPKRPRPKDFWTLEDDDLGEPEKQKRKCPA